MERPTAKNTAPAARANRPTGRDGVIDLSSERGQVMKDNWKRVIIMPGIGLGIGLLIGLVLAGGFSQTKGAPRERAGLAGSGGKVQPPPRPDPDVVTVDEMQAQHLRIEPVQLRQF